MSKYQYHLNKAIESTLAQTIGQVRKDPDGKWIVVISSENIADALNQRLASIDSAQDQVVRKTIVLRRRELVWQF
jgi:sirohydrochlorin ferrochelatase